MGEIPEELLYQGVSVDITFGATQPAFGDLFLICGDHHPLFPPSGAFAFDSLAELQFEQVDDYFGVRSLGEEGDDVPIWLYPLVNGDPVCHHPGPFEGLRLDYNILRNAAALADHYLKCLHSFAAFGTDVIYRTRNVGLGTPADLSLVRADIKSVVAYWASQDIVVGSSESLLIDF